MPIYEYRCCDCDRVFEVVRSMRERDSTEAIECPHCRGAAAERRPSRVAVETDRKGYHPAKPLDV